MNKEIKEILNISNKKYISRVDRDYILDYITNLQEKYNEYKNLYFSEYEVKEDYKSRNEKAIEYINEHQRKDEFLNLNEWQTRDLLNILQGDDKSD